MSSAVGEEVVDDHSTNWKQEDQERPEDLVRDWAIGWQDFNCRQVYQYM